MSRDGHLARLSATTSALRNDVEYSTLVRHYGNGADSEKCYSVAEDEECQMKTLRMSRQGPSSPTTPEGRSFAVRKLTDTDKSVALHFMHYNFSFVHQTRRETPVMAAGITNRAWSIENLVSLTAN